jgi:spore photoproduct lyase
VRQRKSEFVRLFTKTPPGVVCPHFYELVLSNGCPYDCAYCYLRLTFRGNKHPVLFSNPWPKVRSELDAVPGGIFSTGELADSLAVVPPLLPDVLAYFRSQASRYLLLTTKSRNVALLEDSAPTPQVIVSFSINSPAAASRFECLAPPPEARLEAAARLAETGWRVRIRLDPVIAEAGVDGYRSICKRIAYLRSERVTVGTLRQYPGLHRFAPQAPRQGLSRAPDGRMRYAVETRVRLYSQMAEWLGFEPALCKETEEVWERLGWRFSGCNCTT